MHPSLFTFFRTLSKIHWLWRVAYGVSYYERIMYIVFVLSILVLPIVAVKSLCINAYFLFQNLSLGLKWPNDIYAGGMAKVGGLIITSSIVNNVAVCNAGEYFSFIEYKIFLKNRLPFSNASGLRK